MVTCRESGPTKLTNDKWSAHTQFSSQVWAFMLFKLQTHKSNLVSLQKYQSQTPKWLVYSRGTLLIGLHEPYETNYRMRANKCFAWRFKLKKTNWSIGRPPAGPPNTTRMPPTSTPVSAWRHERSTSGWDKAAVLSWERMKAISLTASVWSSRQFLLSAETYEL